MGAARHTDDLERVPIGPLRERYEYLHEHEERIHTVICTWMVDAGFPQYMRVKRNRGVLPDTTHLKRRIGKMGTKCGRTGNMTFAHTIPYEEAVQLARVMGLDPHEAGV